MIKATVIADSVNPAGKRITSFVCVYPRFIHSEILTHRALSRNAASSRAIPVEKMMKRVQEEPAMPIWWGRNQKGMQAREELSPHEQRTAKLLWLHACGNALDSARALTNLGVHKQIANRVLEPFMHMETIITATEWGNFFNQRVHPDAQPEFNALAREMLTALVASTPVKKAWGEWHMPFGDRYLDEGLSQAQRLKICVARCARISYLNFDGDIDHEKDYRLHDDLMKAPHPSPFEHASMAYDPDVFSIVEFDGRDYLMRAARSNFEGFLQYRKFIPNENRSAFNPEALLRGVV